MMRIVLMIGLICSFEQAMCSNTAASKVPKNNYFQETPIIDLGNDGLPSVLRWSCDENVPLLITGDGTLRRFHVLSRMGQEKLKVVEQYSVVESQSNLWFALGSILFLGGAARKFFKPKTGLWKPLIVGAVLVYGALRYRANNVPELYCCSHKIGGLQVGDYLSLRYQEVGPHINASEYVANSNSAPHNTKKLKIITFKQGVSLECCLKPVTAAEIKRNLKVSQTKRSSRRNGVGQL